MWSAEVLGAVELPWAPSWGRRGELAIAKLIWAQLLIALAALQLAREYENAVPKELT